MNSKKRIAVAARTRVGSAPRINKTKAENQTVRWTTLVWSLWSLLEVWCLTWSQGVYLPNLKVKI